MLKKKFEEFLEIMELFLAQRGYQKSRKKGEYCKIVSDKIIKIKIVLSTIISGKNLGEIRVFTALEYPELERLVATLKEERYKKGNNIFYQDIGLLCGESTYHAFIFSCDSNMKYIGIELGVILDQYIFPIMSDYEADEKILDKFERNDTPWRRNYFSGGHANFDFYLRWISLCILNGHIHESFIILENIPGYYGLSNEIEAVKDKLKDLCLEKKQIESFYLLVNNKIKINPSEEEIKKAIIKLDGLRIYFLILEESMQGNYLQIAGGSGEFTLEIRIYNHHHEYNHYRAEMKSEDTRVKNILYGERHISLQVRQVLSIEQVYEITCKYYMDRELHENYNWIKLNI